MPIKAYFTKFLIDRNGLVENRFSPIADYKELENNIKKLLKLDINQKIFSNEENIIKGKAAFYRICITGGPCAGKTSAIQYLKKHLA